jgi:hypothetical protein
MSDPADLTSRTRTRRTVLTGAAAAAIASIAAGRRTDAAAGQPVLQGRVNNAASSRTGLDSSASTSTLRVFNTTGAAVAMISTNGAGGTSSTANRNSYGFAVTNTAAANGSGAAISAGGGKNHGVIAATAAAIKYGLWARNTGPTTNVGAAVRAEGGINDGLVAFTGGAERGALVGVDTTAMTTNVGWGLLTLGDGGIDGDLFVTGIVSAANIPAGGTVTLDGSGRSVVRSDSESSNAAAYDYQLTAIGSAMPNLHVVEGMEGTFTIAGGSPGGRVSWHRTRRVVGRAAHTTADKVLPSRREH